jgi:hypothetical protein
MHDWRFVASGYTETPWWVFSSAMEHEVSCFHPSLIYSTHSILDHLFFFLELNRYSMIGLRTMYVFESREVCVRAQFLAGTSSP